MKIKQIRRDCFTYLFENRINTNLFGDKYYLFVIQNENYWVEISVPTNSNKIMFWDRDFSEYGDTKIAGSFFYVVGPGGNLIRSEEVIKIIDTNADEVGVEYEWTLLQNISRSKKISARSMNGKWYVIHSDGEIVEDTD